MLLPPYSMVVSGNPGFLLRALGVCGPVNKVKAASICLTQPCKSHTVTSAVWITISHKASRIQGGRGHRGESKSHCARACGMGRTL